MSLLHHRTLLPQPIVVSATRAGDEVPDALRLPRLLRAALELWLCIGLVACLLFPDLRGSDVNFGWWPFWLVLWPGLSRALLAWRDRQAEG